jgi:hypothetical protein
MNNTEKLDSIRRTLRRIETQLAIIQRTNVIIFERITGGAFPYSWIIHGNEQAILSQDEAVAFDQLSARLAAAESLESLTERITQIEKQLAIGKDKTVGPYSEK